jgi:hypothetical protein
MEIEMNNVEEILSVLPDSKDDALDAVQVFERCKGFNDQNACSATLSHMYLKMKIIDRYEAQTKAKARFKYWKKPAAKASEQNQAVNQAFKEIMDDIQEPQAASPAAEAPLNYRLTSIAVDTIMAALPEGSLFAISRETGGETRISLSLDDGDQMLINLQPIDIQVALDAYATLQRFKDQQ